MSKPMDMELKRAFDDLQQKMIETRKKIQSIDNQISVFKHLLTHSEMSQAQIDILPSSSETYDPLGRTFVMKNLDEVKLNLKNRESQLKTLSTELFNNKLYLERDLKESEDHLREMVQQRKEQSSQ